MKNLTATVIAILGNASELFGATANCTDGEPCSRMAIINQHAGDIVPVIAVLIGLAFLGRIYMIYRDMLITPVRRRLGWDKLEGMETRAMGTVRDPWASNPYLHKSSVVELGWANEAEAL